MASNIRSISQAHDYKNGNIRPFFYMNGKIAIIYFCNTPKYIRIKMADNVQMAISGDTIYAITYVDMTVEVGKSYGTNSLSIYRSQVVYHTNGSNPDFYEWNPFIVNSPSSVTNTNYSNFSLIYIGAISSTSGFIFDSKKSFDVTTPSGSVEFIY